MTLRELQRLVSTTNYCTYYIKDEFGKVHCMPSHWENVPKQCKDAEIVRAVPRELDTYKVSVTHWDIFVRRAKNERS